MVNVKLETSITTYQLTFEESVTGDNVIVFAYPNCLKPQVATINNVRYEIDDDWEGKVRNLETGRLLGKAQVKPILERINKIIEDGNKYLEIIFSKQFVPTIGGGLK